MSDETESVMQNLLDAGCDEQFAQRFMSMYAERRTKEMLAMLAVRRLVLLESVHADERKIYRLDYLVTKLKNN